MPRAGLLLGDPQPELRGLCSWAWTGSSDPLLSVLKSCGRNLPPETEREVELDPRVPEHTPGRVCLPGSGTLRLDRAACAKQEL